MYVEQLELESFFPVLTPATRCWYRVAVGISGGVTEGRRGGSARRVDAENRVCWCRKVVKGSRAENRVVGAAMGDIP